ncbi:MAG: hypothetical protein Q4G19_06740 [Clostridia bacterium]|nr:hypothetical protein [Clostridia bacterium]
MKRMIVLLLACLTVIFLCPEACAERSEYEAIDSNDDGEQIYYLTVGHCPELYGNIWVGAPGDTLKGYHLDGRLPDGMDLECDDKSIILSGKAEQTGKYAFTVTVQVESPADGLRTTVEKRTCCIVDKPMNEVLFITDGHFSLISENNAAPEPVSPAAGMPPAGHYAGTAMNVRYSPGSMEMLTDGADMSLTLNADGTAVLDLAGNAWQTTWDENGIVSEYGSPGAFKYADGHLSFGWEGGDGYYIYEFDYTGETAPEEKVMNFFDVTAEPPYFIHRAEGLHYGFTDDYLEGCSVWCAVNDYSVSAGASSTLSPQGKYSYEAANIISGDRNNAWVEGAKGYGIDEYIEITRSYEVSDAEYGVDFTELCIVNGYARTPETWAANSRVKELKFSFNGEYVDSLFLQDIMEPQYFDLTPYGLHTDSGTDSVWRFAIVSVYEGDTYQDTAITGIEVRFWTPNH